MRRAAFVIAALGLLFGSPGVANAATYQYWETNGITFIGPYHQDVPHIGGSPDCIWNSVRIHDQYAQPTLWSTSSIELTIRPTPTSIVECADQQYVAAAGQLRVRQDLLFYNNTTSAWNICVQGQWYQNPTPMADLHTSFSWASRPCFWGHYYYGWSQAGSFWNHWHYGVPIQTNLIWLR